MNNLDIKYREYKSKFYLNARHYIYINGKKGEVHPHTWEFSVVIRFEYSKFIEFKDIENPINNFLNKYQNHVLNELNPFDIIIPTLENITDEFAKELYIIIKKLGGDLVRIESAETPTRTYIFDAEQFNLENKDELVNNLIDTITTKRLELMFP